MSDFETHPIGTLKKMERCFELVVKLREQLMTCKTLANKYHELLMAVENKTTGESRHDTALRYIKQSEGYNDVGKEGGGGWI